MLRLFINVINKRNDGAWLCNFIFQNSGATFLKTRNKISLGDKGRTKLRIRLFFLAKNLFTYSNNKKKKMFVINSICLWRYALADGKHLTFSD